MNINKQINYNFLKNVSFVRNYTYQECYENQW